MPGYVPSLGVLETKLVSVFPHNDEAGLPSHQAVIVAFAPETGAPVALMDGTAITASRTAAGSALSTRLLARPDASVLAIIGTGVQARAHGRAIPRVGTFTEIRVAGRNPEKAERLASDLSADLGRAVTAMGTYAEAIDGADVVCATTHSPEPVVRRAWIRPGTHLTSVGVNGEGPEVDAATVADALVVVESRAAALAPFPAGATDLTGPIERGEIGPEHVHAEMGELVAGLKPGRTSDDQITLYKSVGIAAMDAAAVSLVLRMAREQGAGLEVELG
jgi:alanine dehydrogenase